MCTEYIYGLSIAGIPIQLKTKILFSVEEAFEPFFNEEDSLGYIVSFHKVSELRSIPKAVIHESHCYRVHSDGNGGYVKSFFDESKDLEPYALAKYDYENGKIQVDYLEKGEHCVSEMSNSFFHLGIEALMLHEDRLCFHAACVNTYLGGILFTGPSGVGKSTQAEFWCKYEDAKLINGDRPIISKDENIYRAWGSPYAGSSKCYINENCKIRAIVVLHQAEHCSMRRLDVKEAFTEIYKGLTIYSWDRNFVEKATDMAIEMAHAIPVYEFFCTAGEDAVRFLEKELQKD